MDIESVAEDIPCFNKADSIAPDVHHFYNFWTNFVTKMSFSWEDKYNPAEVPNRQVRRAIEKENKKFRDIARKKYNETVRALASFVRKRDPRVMSFELEARARKLEDEMKKAGDKLDVESKRKERRELSRINLESNGEEVIRRQLEREGAYLLADNSSDDDSYDELAEADLEDIKANAAAILSSCENTAAEGDNAEEESSCDICSKTFKTDAQLMQHLASKTHRKKAQDAEKKPKKSAVKKNVEKEANLNSRMCGKDRSEIGCFKKNGKQYTEEKVAGTSATAEDIVTDTSRRGQVVTCGHSDSEESEGSDSDNFPEGVLKEDSVLSEEDGDDIDVAVASLAGLKLGVLDGSIGDVVKTKNKYKKKEKLGYFPRPVTREVIPPSLFEADDTQSSLRGEDVDIAIMPGPQKKKRKKISLRGF